METKLSTKPIIPEYGEIPKPELVIRPQTPDEEMDYLWFVLKGVPFYREHKYTFEIPDHPEFQKLAQISPNFDDVDRDATKKLFVAELYNPDFYKPGLAALEAERPRIEKAFLGMVEFNQKWGFKLFPQYQLALTRYGPGGMYHEDTGVVVMMTRNDGTFKRPHPSHTPVHEMVHIGIEEGIVKRFKLAHREKERLVDLITSNKFGSFLPGYQLQDLGDPKIDPYITDEALNNLPLAIENFVKDFPRD